MSEMWYTEKEILHEVGTALNPYEQISILAELNGCKRSEIEKVLKKYGEPLPKPQRATGHRTRVGRPITNIEEAEKRRADKRAYYLRHRERLIEQAKERQRRVKHDIERIPRADTPCGYQDSSASGET